MRNIYTKDYIEYLLEMGLLELTESAQVVESELNSDEMEWVQNIETSSGEEVVEQIQNPQDSIIEELTNDEENQFNQDVQEAYTPDNGAHVSHAFRSFFSPDILNVQTSIDNDLLSSQLTIPLSVVGSSLEQTEISYTNDGIIGTEPLGVGFLTFSNIELITNVSPEAAYDFFATSMNSSVTGNVLIDNGFGADFDADGGLLSVVSGTVTTNSGGSLTISSDGGFLYTPLNGYTGADYFSYVLVDSNGGTDTARVDVHVSAGDLVTHIDFSNAVFSDYGVTHNESDVYSVADDGRTLHMADNTWKDIALDYTVTDNTVIEFDYFSTKAGQIQGLGFDRDDDISEPYTFKVFGTQDWGNSTYETYEGNEGNWFHYTIEVGSFYTGDFNRLFFVNDDDEYVGSNGSFRDVTIYEAASDADDTYTGSSGSETIMGLGGDDLIYGMDGDDVLYGGSGIDFLFGGNGADTFVFDDINDADHVQDFDVNDGDILDISNLLTGYDPVTDAIADFVTVTSDGSQTVVYVDGDGGADSFVQVAVLHGVADVGSVESLEDAGALVTV